MNNANERALEFNIHRAHFNEEATKSLKRIERTTTKTKMLQNFKSEQYESVIYHRDLSITKNFIFNSKTNIKFDITFYCNTTNKINVHSYLSNSTKHSR